MTILQSPEKKVEGILKEIEKGKTNEGDISSLVQVIGEHQAMIPEVLGSLASIMASDDPKSFISACHALNRITDEHPDMVSGSMEEIMARLSDRNKPLSESEWTPALEFFTKMNEAHPESMKTAVPSLLAALENTNKIVSESAYCILAIVASKNPYFFKYSSNELIKALNSLNIDQRLYACRIIGIIAAIDPAIVEKTYEVIEDISLNHPDTHLRSEAGAAVDMLRPKKAARQPLIQVPLVKQENIQADAGVTPLKLDDIQPPVTPAKREEIQPEMKNMPQETQPVQQTGETGKSRIENVLGTMISDRIVESAALAGNNGRIIALSGARMDETLLGKIAPILSLDSEHQSTGRIIIEQTGKKIVAVGVGGKVFLVVMTGSNTSMDTLFIVLNKSVEKLKDILMDAGTQTL